MTAIHDAERLIRENGLSRTQARLLREQVMSEAAISHELQVKREDQAVLDQCSDPESDLTDLESLFGTESIFLSEPSRSDCFSASDASSVYTKEKVVQDGVLRIKVDPSHIPLHHPIRQAQKFDYENHLKLLWRELPVKQEISVHVQEQPLGRPRVWSNTRQELCESLPYFRSYQSGIYVKNGVCRVPAFADIRWF